MTYTLAGAAHAAGGAVLVAMLGACGTLPAPADAPLADAAGLTEPAPIEVGVVPPPGPYAPGFDAIHYDIDIEVPATGTRIGAVARLALALVEPRQDTLRLDLTGLRVLDVLTVTGGVAPNRAAFRQENGKLIVPVPAGARTGDTIQVHVSYGGEPDDGLIIRANVHGQHGAFGDDWPNRARFWFPSIDHPSDKATVTWRVRAPAGWHVIANGRRFEGARPPVAAATGQGSGTTREELATPPRDGVWQFHMPVPIPTYLMVIGATPFSIGTVTDCARGGISAARADSCVPVSSWAFPTDSASAARSFRRGGDMVEFFSRIVAPFPYTNLAHVQSATRFGGMENASAIFYSERAIADGRDIEGTVAHEVAHQWFGDAVTPRDWAHLWLSEGFASYFGPLYFEHADGVERFREIMAGVRRGYLESDVRNLAVVDTLAVPGNNLLELLNANSYQKGGLVLHMLRGIMGDTNFFAGVQRYYRAHEHGTATTADLRSALEVQHGASLAWFFDQWLFRPGHPVLRSAMRWDAAAGEVVVTIEQTQQADWPTFRLPITIEFDVPGAAGSPATTVRHDTEVRERSTTIRVPLPARPGAMRLDPDGWLVFATG